jgi:hypothetical protein
MIQLTAKDYAIERMEKVSVEMNAKIMKGVSVAEQQRLVEALSKMKVNLIAMDTVSGTKLCTRLP